MLAGRRDDAVHALADRLGLRHRVFGLEDRRALVRGLDGMTAVLHAAGPFSATSAPMAEACIAAGVHYCDITGEIDVFEHLVARNARAKEAGVMLMPGVGFDVVPSDCLAAHVAARLPDATRLCLSVGGLTRASRGTAKTMVEAVAQGTRVRSKGHIVLAKGTPTETADLGSGLRPIVGVSWGDVSTAWHSTGIPNVEVFFEADRTVVTGPTVVMPLLRNTRLQARPASFFKWEAIVNDPIGALMAAVVLAIMIAGGRPGTWLAAEVVEGLVAAVALGMGAALLFRHLVNHDLVQESLRSGQLKQAHEQERIAQIQRQAAEQAKATAEQQPTLVKAQIGVQTADLNAKKRRAEGQGEQEYLSQVAAGQKAQAEVLGKDAAPQLQVVKLLLDAVQAKAEIKHLRVRGVRTERVGFAGFLDALTSVCSCHWRLLRSISI